MLDPSGPAAQRRGWRNRPHLRKLVYVSDAAWRVRPVAPRPVFRHVSRAHMLCIHLRSSLEDAVAMYKEFLGEVVVWLIPVVVLVALALMVTSHAG